MILSNRAPISTGQQVLITSRLPIDVMSENWNHTLISLLEIIIQHREILGFTDLMIKMMQLITLIKYVTHHLRRWRIHDCGGDHIGHVAMILVFWYLQLRIREELADSCHVNIAAAGIISDRPIEISVADTDLRYVTLTDFSAAIS